MTKLSVTLPEAIAMTGIGRSTFYVLFNEGKLRPIKSGRRTLIMVEEIERYVRSLPAAYPVS